MRACAIAIERQVLRISDRECRAVRQSPRSTSTGISARDFCALCSAIGHASTVDREHQNVIVLGSVQITQSTDAQWR